MATYKVRIIKSGLIEAVNKADAIKNAITNLTDVEPTIEILDGNSLMADKLREQIDIPLIELVTNPEFITAAYKCLGSDSPDVIGLVDMPQAVECKAKILNLFKSQGYLSPEEHRKKVERVSKEITTDLLENHKAKMTESKKQFKSQIEGLTVIGDEEIRKRLDEWFMVDTAAMAHGTDKPDIVDAVKDFIKAQLQDCQRQLGGME